jgi:hypothetical protein
VGGASQVLLLLFLMSHFLIGPSPHKKDFESSPK